MKHASLARPSSRRSSSIRSQVRVTIPQGLAAKAARRTLTGTCEQCAFAVCRSVPGARRESAFRSGCFQAFQLVLNRSACFLDEYSGLDVGRVGWEPPHPQQTQPHMVCFNLTQGKPNANLPTPKQLKAGFRRPTAGPCNACASFARRTHTQSNRGLAVPGRNPKIGIRVSVHACCHGSSCMLSCQGVG